MKRKNKNSGVFADLEVPMQKRAVEKICREYGVDISGLTIKIQRDPKWLNSFICGIAAHDDVGRIDLTAKAFANECEML